jgi:hypothetical protein
MGAGVVMKRSGADYDSAHEFFRSLFSPAWPPLRAALRSN